MIVVWLLSNYGIFIGESYVLIRKLGKCLFFLLFIIRDNFDYGLGMGSFLKWEMIEILYFIKVWYFCFLFFLFYYIYRDILFILCSYFILMYKVIEVVIYNLFWFEIKWYVDILFYGSGAPDLRFRVIFRGRLRGGRIGG